MDSFAGFIGCDRLPERTATASRMGAALAYPQPGRMEPFHEDRLALALIAASAGPRPGVLPLEWDSTNTFGLLFWGETFPTVDPAQLLADYASSGPACLLALNGIFCGCIVDRRTLRLLLFTDRFGLGRVYYHVAADGIYFATTAKAILAVQPALRSLTPQGVAEFLTTGCVMEHRTLFPDIYTLPPGAVWTIDARGTLQRGHYFDPSSWEQVSPLTPAEYGEQLRTVFRRIAPTYGEPRGAVAMSLTGGLDSRMLLSWLPASPGTLPCYTFGSPYRDCADVRIARSLAARVGQTHTTLPIQADFFADFDRLAQETVWLSDGTMDVSGAVELYVNRAARAIAPIRLTGNYGSEILRYNIAFRPQRQDPAKHPSEFWPQLLQAESTYREAAQGHPLSFIVAKQVPWYHFARRSIEAAVLQPRSPFLDHALVALAFRLPPSLIGSPQPLLELIAAGNPALAALRTDRSHSLQRSWAQQLSHYWQEFTVRAEYACDYGMPAWLARWDRLLAHSRWERLFLGRHKFYHFRVWYRDRLAVHFPPAAALEPLAPFYRPKFLAELFAEHRTGQRNHTLDLHRVLTLHHLQSSYLPTLARLG